MSGTEKELPQKPEDTSELSLDESSLNTYREQLGLVAPQEKEEGEEPASGEVQESDSSLDDFTPVQPDTSEQE